MPSPAAFKALEAISTAFFRLIVRNKGDDGARDCFLCSKSEVAELAALLDQHFQPAGEIASGLGALKNGESAPVAHTPESIRPVVMPDNSTASADLVATITRLIETGRKYRVSNLATMLNLSVGDVELAINRQGSGLIVRAGGWVALAGALEK